LLYESKGRFWAVLFPSLWKEISVKANPAPGRKKIKNAATVLSGFMLECRHETGQV